MIQQTKLNRLTQTLDEVLTKQNCQEENCNQMKTSIKRRFIDMLTLDNIDWIFFRSGFKLLILIMASMFIIEKTIAIFVIISDHINTMIKFMRIIITTANPVCVKNNKKNK